MLIYKINFGKRFYSPVVRSSIYLFIFFFTYSFQNINAQNTLNFSPKQHLAYTAILQLKLHQAKEILKDNKNELAYSDKKIFSAIDVYLNSYITVLELLALQDDSLYEVKKEQKDIYLAKVKNIDIQSPAHLFLQAEIKIQWALVGFMFGENLSSAWSIKQAYHLLNQNQQLFPDFIPNQKSLGVLHVALGSVPEKYHWLMELVGLEGDIKKGLKEMMQVISKDTTFSLETKLLLMLSQTYILHEPEKVFLAYQNEVPNSNSPLFQFIFSIISLKAGKILDNHFVSQTYPSLTQQGVLYSPFFDYIKGEISLLSGDYNQAIGFYEDFLSNFKGKNYVKSAYYRLFLAHWFLDSPKAKDYLILCLQKGQTQIEADKNAESFATQKELPNKKLMQARLFTDGGLYENAWRIINQLSENQIISKKEKIEYVYRKARISDKQGNYDVATDLYLQTISLSGNLPYYFAPNAALNLGYIYQNILNNPKTAQMYFEKVLTYPKHDYKNSLDHKAKTAIKKLKQYK